MEEGTILQSTTAFTALMGMRTRRQKSTTRVHHVGGEAELRAKPNGVLCVVRVLTTASDFVEVRESPAASSTAALVSCRDRRTAAE